MSQRGHSSTVARRHYDAGVSVAIEVDNLRVQYAGRDEAALGGVSFDVGEGEFLGLLGPNGSGKSTLFKVLATLLRPTDGSAKVGGVDVLEDPAAVRRQLGVVFQHPALDKELTGRENLTCHGRLLGLPRRVVDERADSLVAAVGAGEFQHAIVKTLSGGMRRRLEIAKSLMGLPRVLLLDEPTVGLDPASRRRTWAMLDEIRRASAQPLTIVLTTHLMDEAAACDRLVLLNEGDVVAQGTPAELTEQAGGAIVTLVPEDLADVGRLAEAAGNGQAAQVIGGLVRIEYDPGPELVRAAMAGELGVAVREASVGKPVLEDAFIRLTGRGLGDE